MLICVYINKFGDSISKANMMDVNVRNTYMKRGNYSQNFTNAYVSFDTTKVSNSEQSWFLKSAVDDKTKIGFQDAGGLAKAPSPPCNQ